MRLVKLFLSFILAATIPCLAAQQPQPLQTQPDSKPAQTARQALIEILSGKGDIAKHLTVEVQQEMQKKHRPGERFTPAVILGAMHAAADPNVKTFDTGAILLSETDPKLHERTEVHVDSDDLNSDQATLQLSIHQYVDDKEVDTPWQFVSQISITMKKQENIWRLNEIGIGAKLPVGDPAMFRKLNEQTQAAGTDVAVGGGTGLYAAAGGASLEAAEIPKRDMQTTLSLISFHEQAYASRHPEQGFTCSLADLMEGNDGAFGLDPQIKTGIYDGYRINATGCQGLPVGSYQITAEPISASAGSKAFCTDATHNVRQSDDGRGSTCLSSGHFPANKSFVPEPHTEFVIH